MGLKGKTTTTTTTTNQRVELASDFTTTSTTYVDVTGMSVNLPNKPNGKFMAIFSAIYFVSVANTSFSVRFVDGGTNKNALSPTAYLDRQCLALVLTGDLNGQVLKVQAKINANTLTLEGLADSKTHLEVIEIP